MAITSPSTRQGADANVEAPRPQLPFQNAVRPGPPSQVILGAPAAQEAPVQPAQRPSQVSGEMFQQEPYQQQERPEQQERQQPQQEREQAISGLGSLSMLAEQAPDSLTPGVTTAQPQRQAAIDSGYAQPAAPTVAMEDSMVELFAGPQAQVTQEVVPERPEAPPELPLSSAIVATSTPPPTSPAGVTRTTALPILEDPAPVRVNNIDNKRNVERATVLATEKQKRKDIADTVRAREGFGQGLSGQVYSDPSLSLEEASFGTDEMVAALKQPQSRLRDLVAEYAPEADLQAMLNDDVLSSQILLNMFNETPGGIRLLVTKDPVVAESDANTRIIRVHEGRDAALHPLAAKMFNADHDGDKIKVSFDVTEATPAKTAMDFLIGTDNEVKIDADFFNLLPWANTVEETADTLEDVFQRDADLNRYLYAQGGITRAKVNSLAKAIQSAWQGNEDGLRSLLRWSRDIGSLDGAAPAELSDNITARVVQAIYNYNSEIWAARAHYDMDNYFYAPMQGPLNKTQLPLDNSVRGSSFANMYDYLRMIGAPVTQIPKKNQAFRMAASIGKVIRATPEAMIGEDSWIDYKRHGSRTGDAEEVIAKHMSGVISLSDAQFGPATYMRNRVVKHTAWPAHPSYAVKNTSGETTIDFTAFVDAFISQYNFYQSALAQASIVVKSDWTIENLSTGHKPIRTGGDTVANKEIRGAFKSIYGEFTMGSLFGAEAPRGWEDVSLNDYVIKSRGRMEDKNPDVSTVKQFIKSLDDFRYGEARKLNDTLNTALLKNVGKLKVELQRNGKSLGKDVDALTKSLHLIGKDAFSHFGFVSVAEFNDSVLGQKLINAQTADQLGGVVYEAIGRYRLDPLYKAQEAGDSLTLQTRLDELASISDTWRALVEDFRSDGSLLQLTLRTRSNYSQESHKNKIWDQLRLRIINERGQEGTAIDEILLGDLTKKEKDIALNQLQKAMVSRNPFQQDFEIASDLYANPKGLYAGPPWLSDFGQNETLTNFKASNDAIDSYVKSNDEAYKRQVRDASRADAEMSPSNLNTSLKKIASGEINLVQIPTALYSDAILSGMEKTYDDTEKSSQQISVNTLYSALAYQKNGGLFSDVAITDDFFLGKIALDRFLNWSVGIAKILSDPNYSVEVYDGTGSISLDRSVLLGIEERYITDDAIWNYLVDNPRIAMTLRRGTVTSWDDAETSSYTATSSLKDSIVDMAIGDTPNAQALAILADSPGFASVVALTIPRQGRKKRQTLKQGENNINNVISALREIASKPNIREFVSDLVPDIIGTDLDNYPDEYNFTDGRIYNIKDQLPKHLIMNISTYAERLKEAGLALPEGESSSDVEFYFDDDSTIQSYFDVIQVLSGAKTEISTGINGAESQRNANLAFVSSYRLPDPCTSPEPPPITAEIFRNNWEQYDRMRTVDGQTITETTWELIADTAPEGMVSIEDPAACNHPSGFPCNRHRMADPSTNLTGETQTSPLSRFMLDKRAFGTEQLNLKIKTVGDDGSDSISKNSIWVDNLAERLGQIDAAFYATPEGDIAGARRVLARQLYEKNISINYNSLTENDYINIAQTMLQVRLNEVTQVPTLEVLSVGQLSQIVKEAVAQKVRQAGDLSQQEIVNAGLEAIARYGAGMPLDVSSIGPMVKVAPQGKLRSNTVEQRQSSLVRNLQLVEELKVRESESYSAPEIEDFASTYKEQYPAIYNDLQKAGLVSTIQNDPSPHSGYNFLGVIDTNGYSAIDAVGPKTLWVIDGSANLDRTLVMDSLDLAESLGITVIFRNLTEQMIDAASHYIQQSHDIGNGLSMIPFFDVKLNGPNTVGAVGATTIGGHYIHPSNLTRIVEDVHNSEQLSDSDFQPTSNFADRISVKTDGQYRVNLMGAFSNFVAAHPGEEIQFSLPSRVDIEFNIISGNTGLPGPVAEGIIIDPGERVTSDKVLDKDIARYIARFQQGEVDNQGWITSAKPNEIVGWLYAVADKDAAWHPVRMYDIRQGKRSPDNFDIDGYAFDQMKDTLSRGELVIGWKYESGVYRKTFKMFEDWGASNKMMARPEPPKHMPYRYLANGNSIDGYVAAPSTSGRRLGYQAQQAMATLFAEARTSNLGYNFAEAEGSFPADEVLKEGQRTGTLTIGDWKLALERGTVEFFPRGFANKATMDAFANEMANKAIAAGINPTEVFASQFNGTPTYFWFRFNVLFNSSIQFKDNLMTMFNYMDPSICPKPVSGEGPLDSRNTLFNDQLQMLVPFTNAKGDVIHDWAYVYTRLNFLDDHFSGLSAPGIKASSKSMSVNNTMLYGGKWMNEDNLHDYLGWSLWDKPGGLSDGWMLADDSETEADNV